MKLKHLLTIVPIVGLLAGCGETEIKLDKADSPLVSTETTHAPVNLVVYPDDRPSIPDGKVVFAKMQCAQCHSAGGGQGGAVTGASTTGAGAGAQAAAAATTTAAATGEHGGRVRTADISSEQWAASVKPVDVYRFLTYGDGKTDHHTMQGKLTNNQIWALTVYVKSIGTPPLTQKEIDEIAPVFGANCAVCHGTKGDGDGPLMRNMEPLPANFQTFARFYDRTDEVLWDHIANGIKWEGMPNFLGKTDNAKGVKFDQAYIKKLVAYVRNFHISNEPTMAAAATSSAAPAAPAQGGNASGKPAPASH